MAVPHYGNLLQDQTDEDESERGRTLVQSESDWRCEMAKWIAAAQDAERAADDDSGLDETLSDDNIEQVTPSETTASSPEGTRVHRLAHLRPPRKWKAITLAKLFGKSTKPSLRVRISRRAMEMEEDYMLFMAQASEDPILDDGEVEIDDDEVYGE
jgi:hypothetical protein